MVVMSRLLPDHVVQRLATGPGSGWLYNRPNELIGRRTDMHHMHLFDIGCECLCDSNRCFRCLYRTGNPVVGILIPYVSPIFQMQVHFWKICGVGKSSVEVLH
ncbi:hypothetical protein PIB30_093224 [Stylosanthes scabra]|uniref:Uncharacterized protein n=1 Tax=Stylosanthes scabra TaxID=79078 RepID=A0ABU6VTK9_9FABA|nr:hypothetical protein [Stylosanthes scabra]